ncbi:angiopoietin-related protein 6-like [Mytilus californianus]|uniref:angiopoietin-related protein 6-like n=1 Tax=Mytilus californianus TaxID=6549 RepID=UPI002247F76C|nr:angiopoietin-related protein 6-like [Mytilus californianus]
MEVLMKGLAFIIFVTLYNQYRCLLEEFCEQDDFECKHHNNIDGIGYLQHDRSQQSNILRRLQQLSLVECARECFLTSWCVAMNYRKNWKLCDLLGHLTAGENLQIEAGSIYTKRSTWSKSLAGSCADHTCFAGEKCSKLRTGGNNCTSVYCKDPIPITDKSVCIETFGLYRNLKAGNQFECKAGYFMIGRPFIVCNEKGKWNKMFSCTDNKFVPRDCNDFSQGSVSGVYTIYPKDTKFDVYCDMETAGFGWTVFQRRINGTIDFYRGWSDYEDGFGNLISEFWLGNKYMHHLTSTANYKLYIHLEDFEGNSRYAEYSEFSIGDAATNYILNVEGYSGNAGDSLSYPGDQNHNGMMFSTIDRDNDRYQDNCAARFKGAWWYNACHLANLNREYLGGQYSSEANGIVWEKWKGYQYSLKTTKIMIKRH